MDPPSCDPRDQILSLLTSLVVNGTTARVSPMVVAPMTSNSLVVQVRSTQF